MWYNRDSVLSHGSVDPSRPREDRHSGWRTDSAPAERRDARTAAEKKRDREHNELLKLLKTVAQDEGIEDLERALERFNLMSPAEVALAIKRAVETKNAAIKRFLRLVQRAKVADVCFLVDCTGSMTKHIDGVRSSIQTVVDRLKRPPRTASGRTSPVQDITRLRIAFVGYRDVDARVNVEHLDFTEDVDAFKAFVQNIRTMSGKHPDVCEDVFSGLEQVARLRWSQDAGCKMVFHIADAPCHGKQFHDGVHDHYAEEGDPLRRRLKDLLAPFIAGEWNYYFGRIRKQTDKMIRVFSGQLGYTIERIDVKDPIKIEDSVVVSVLSSKMKSTSGSIGADYQVREFTMVDAVPDFDDLPQLFGTVASYVLPSSIREIKDDLALDKKPPKKIFFKVAENPFSAGTERLAYHGLDVTEFRGVPNNERLVFKEYKHVGRGMNAPRRYEEAIKIQTIAAFLLQAFANALDSDHRSFPLGILKARVVDLKLDDGRRRYMHVEPFLRDTPKFVRVSNNADYIVSDTRAERDGLPLSLRNLAVAFSHFTYQLSSGYLMVVDLQGAVVDSSADDSDGYASDGDYLAGRSACVTEKRLLLTDPAIHCKDRLRFGRLNNCEEGFRLFRAAHVCMPAVQLRQLSW